MKVPSYNLRNKNLPADLVYQIEALVQAISTYEPPVNGNRVNPRTGFSALQEQFITGLLGPFGQAPIGTTEGDPLLEQVGSGTVTSITITAGNQLTGGGTITTSGTISVAVTATPTFTTVNVGVGGYLVSGTKVVGAQGAAVADAAGGATVDAEARTAINDLLARLRTHGLIAT